MARRLSESERKLWMQVTRHVRRTAPRRKDEDEEAAAAEPAPVAAAVPAPAERRKPATRRTPASPPQDVSNQKRVRRGQAEIDARIDLHGHTQDAARGELSRFIRSQQKLGARCVLVITGKGRAGGGVIRARFIDWLDDKELRPLIAGYSRAHIRHGGEGAFYVMLKARRAD